MSEEIKRVLDYLKDKKGYAINEFGAHKELTPEENNKLLHYITNLQEENERLKKAVKENVIATCNTCEWFGVCPHSYKEYDYKAQIDKAIEYIKWNLDKNEELIEYFNYDANFNELLDILKGDKHE